MEERAKMAARLALEDAISGRGAGLRVVVVVLDPASDFVGVASTEDEVTTALMLDAASQKGT